MADTLTKKIKWVILLSSLTVVFVLSMEARRENLKASWRQHQVDYKAELVRMASTETEQNTANSYGIKMRQIVLEELELVDRCTICHVAMEDPRTAALNHPLKSHPGNMLEIHDVDRFGCTVCHGGQGRAVTAAESKAHGHEFFWEDPVLPAEFLEARCLQCHDVSEMPEDSVVRRGREVFRNEGCLGCHVLEGLGPSSGTDLSNVGKESFHVKYPHGKKKKEYLERFEHNKNVAYLYESIVEPDAEEQGSQMMSFKLEDKDVLALVSYIKGASGHGVPNTFHTDTYKRQKLDREEFSGEQLYTMYCQVCHGKDGVGGVKNPNSIDGEIPGLESVKDGYERDELIDEVEAGIEVRKKDPKGPMPMSMPPWRDALNKEEFNKLVDYLFTFSDE